MLLLQPVSLRATRHWGLPLIIWEAAALPRLRTQAIPGGTVTPPPVEAPAPDPIGDLLSGNPAPAEAPAEKPKTEDIPF